MHNAVAQMHQSIYISKYDQNLKTNYTKTITGSSDAALLQRFENTAVKR